MKVMTIGLLMALLLGGCAPHALQGLPVPMKETPKPVKKEKARPVEAATDADRALAKEWRELEQRWGKDPAAREILNHTRAPWNMVTVTRLAGETPGSPKDMAWARGYLSGQVKQLRLLKDWPEAREYKIALAVRVIEGDVIDDAALWAPASEIMIGYPVRELGPVADEAVCRMLWDAKALHLLYRVTDSQIVCPAKNRDEPVWKDDCVELFVLGDKALASGKPVFWEFNLSPDGVVYDARNTKEPDQWGGEMDVKSDFPGLRVYTRRRPGGYAVQVSLPWGSMPGLKQPVGRGMQLWMLAGWAQKSEGEPTEYYGHAPALGWFHNIWAYSKFTLD
jgi:hypothetical protein